ncbi:LysM peptidoglycan-binding domain-containing protein [Marimonas lutisalis]|uniref:LysM peptidoglycan-binding domain-containing protein n=1 Tax=Marimonas lutisalis TaxID=2545756 RepID=UPI0010F7C12E|nr:LysM peptidoglycan-binding domain-containing protein [Marimonas lutisalis]
MSKLAGLTGVQGLTLAGVAAVVIAGAGAYFAGVFTPEPVEEPQPVAVVPEAAPSQQSAAVTPAPEPEPVPEPAPEPATEADAPRRPAFDLVRVEPDGSTMVAGRGEPGAEIVIELDGEELARVTTGSDGNFASFLQLPPAEMARVMRLVMPVEGAEPLTSAEEAILAPVRVAVAEAVTAEEPTAGESEPAAAETTAQEGAAEEPKVEMAASETPSEPKAPTAPVAQSQTVVMMTSQEGVRVVQPPAPREAAPEVMSAVAVDTISYSDEGEVQIAGRGQGSRFVRVYLDNTPITTSRIAEDGNWRTDLPDVDTGVYTLRVDEIDEEGAVVSRVETPFKREDQQVVAEAGEVTAITVQPGNTLWAIARERYGEGTLYVRLFEANKDRIRNPDLIYPGQVFDIPQD